MITAPTPEEVEQIVRWAQEVKIPPAELAQLGIDIRKILHRDTHPLPDLRQEE